MIPIRAVALAALSLSLAVATLPAAPAQAAPADREEPKSAPANPDVAAGRQAIDAGNWQAAIAAYTKVVQADPSNADAFNYLGFANRKLGKHDQAFANYQKALTINPEHKGAHEYIGEAYLETNNLAKAEEHLKALDKICFFSCSEYTELKARVAAYKSKRGS